MKELVDSSYDLLVIDYSKEGDESTRFTAAELDQIRSGDKTLLSYISIGEAETYRSYFQQSWLDSSPSWLGEENPEWEGNYKVKYWDPGWQAIIYDYIDKIIQAGFDGLYLDIIDAYEYYEENIPDAAQRMINWVANISSYFKTAVPGGLIIPQNGEPLLDDPYYRSVIDGIGREDLYVLPDEQEQRDSSEIEEIEGYLNLLNDSQLVLVVDYTDHADLIEFAREQAAEQGYLHYIGVLELDQLLPPDYTGRTLIQRLLLPVTGGIIIIGILVYFVIRSRRQSSSS